MFDSGPGEDLRESRGEILQDDDGLGAGIVQLMFELARRIERIAVHHRVAGAQRAEQRDRVLQDVGHHQRDARALRKFQRSLAGSRQNTRVS